MTSPLLFVASDRREAEPWVARWRDSRPLPLPVHWARAGTWQGRDVIAIANGVGRARATAAVQVACAATGNPSGVCSIGTGGALDPSLAIADVIVATHVTDGGNSWTTLDPHGPPSRRGLVHSAPHIVRTSEEKSNLRRSGAILVEMEAAGIAQAALELAVPFYCIRVVSDLANQTFLLDFEDFLMPNGLFNVPRLVMHALAHPVNGLGELLRLQRHTALAAKRLAEFLAHCTF